MAIIPVVSVSGGKDSTALYLHALENCRNGFVPVFADTGNEHELTLEYVTRLPERTGGPQIRWVKANFSEALQKRINFVREFYPEERCDMATRALSNPEAEISPFLGLTLWKGMFPSNIKRFCTTFLKTLPIQTVIDEYLDAGHEVESWQGIRAEESVSRSRLTPRELVDEGVTICRPILHKTVREVFAIHKRHGIAPNPLYSLGMGRVGCMPCIMARKQEIAEIVRRFPWHIAKIRRWEHLVQTASKKGIATFFPCTKVPGTTDMRASIDNVVSWSQTMRGGRQYSLEHFLALPACKSQYGLCE